MPKHKKYPPSFYRYRAKHPVISVTLTSDLKEVLDKHRGDLSYSQIVKRSLEKSSSVLNYEHQIKELSNRIAELEKIYWYVVDCPACNTKLMISNDGHIKRA